MNECKCKVCYCSCTPSHHLCAASMECECHKQSSVNSGEVEKCLNCGRISPVVSMANCPFCQPDQKAEGGEWGEEFTKRFVQGHGPIPNGANDIQESDSWIEASPEEMKDFIRNLLQSRESQIREKRMVEIDEAFDAGYERGKKDAAEIVEKCKLSGLEDPPFTQQYFNDDLEKLKNQILNNSPL